jgi:glycosyltransferase involved in cell wall biosynthesis
MRIAILTTDNREHFKDYGSPHPRFGTAPQALLEGLALLPELEVHVISCTQRVMSSPGKLSENIWFHSLHVPKWGWLRTGYQGCIRAVRKKLKEIQPDIVHGQGTERDCAMSAVLSGYPNVLTIHGNMRVHASRGGTRGRPYYKLAAFLEGYCLKRTGGVVAISRYTEDLVKDFTPRTWLLPNPVDPSFLSLGEKRMDGSLKIEVRSWDQEKGVPLDSRRKAPIILVVANVDERKNQNVFIRALDPLAKRMRFEVRFFGGCGASDYAREFRELIATRPWCHYGGLIGRGELRTQFEQADMLALPTHEDNCPMVVLEAQAAGVPVMASKVGGIPDLIDGITTGLFCDPRDHRTLVEGVERLLNDRDFASKIARHAHDDAVKRFHPRVIAKRHLEIYREILGR